MVAKKFVRKFLKIAGIILGILLVLLIGFHFWFKANARHLIEDLVESESNGKLKLKIGKFHFSYFSRNIEIEKAVFYNTDTVNGSTAYRFSVDKIKLKAKAILPIVFKKRILIDSLQLQHPHIQVTRLRATDSTGKKNKKDVSIPEEMGKVYSSIQDALRVLNVKRFQIDDGTFTLINKIVPDQQPLNITNLHFHIDNLQVDTGKLTGNEKLLFSDNIVLRTRNQNILFPDGRHRLSFSRFRINLQRKMVEFDSCTIAATRSDSSSAAFTIFFDALFLTNIDFDTLYKSEVIKADSVYCVNPKFNLDVQLGKKKGANKPPPKLGDIIKQLTGDLQLGYVVVSNADFNIKTVKDNNPSSFTFSNNNFEMQGLSIDQDAARPLKVKNFAMAIRNYENFIKDSSYSIKFDSVLFKDDRITLSNFLFNKLVNGKISNTFSIPQFSLYGLSWDELVFERRLKAEQAIMFRPYISYTARVNSKKKAGRQNIFQSLGAINDYMKLQYLDIIDGTIDLNLKNNLRVQLQNASISVQSNSLLTSTGLSGIKNSLTDLNFKTGEIQSGNLTMLLNDIRYAGKNGQFSAGSILVKNKEKNMFIDLQKVAVEKMQVNEITGSVFANGVKWQQGDVKINTGGKAEKNSTDASVIELKNIHGTNTTVNAVVGGKSIAADLSGIFFNELIKKPGSKLVLDGLDITGKELEVKDSELNLSVATYDITDNKSSSFRQIVYKSNNGKTDARISIPLLTVIPHVQPLLNGDIALDAIDMVKPVINLRMASGNVPNKNKKAVLPKIDISELKLTQPKINFTQVTDSGTVSLSWQGERNSLNYLQGNDLHTSSGVTAVSNLKFYLTDFVFVNPKGKTFATGEGKVAAQIKNIRLEQEEKKPLVWNLFLIRLDAEDFHFDSTDKRKGTFVINQAGLDNLNISSSTITNLQKIAAANSSFQIKQFTGHYSNDNHMLRWYNAGFNRSNNTFSLDSFVLKQTLGKDSFLAKQSYQNDYINLKTGAISAGPVDFDKYISDNILNTGTVTVDKLFFTDYKDKQLPFNAGIIKPLPVNMIKKIPLQLSIDTVLLSNANVEYTEVNEKTKKPGTIPVTRMTVRLLAVKNYNIKPRDSLAIQASGYLMDTAWIRLRVKESYTDSLGGFLMTVRMKPADFTVLNPVLIPLASVKLESAYLDTLSMRAIGREYLSLGEMKMFYHDLKIRFLKNGSEAKKTFITGLITFFANSFIIRTNNKYRTGRVFFIRNRDRSAINYLIKIAMSGVTSSIGAKSNRKMMRRYKKELQERNLPPIDFE